MKKKLLLVFVLIGGVLVGLSCSGDTDSSEHEVTRTPTPILTPAFTPIPTPTPTPAPTTSDVSVSMPYDDYIGDESPADDILNLNVTRVVPVEITVTNGELASDVHVLLEIDAMCNPTWVPEPGDSVFAPVYEFEGEGFGNGLTFEMSNQDADGDAQADGDMAPLEVRTVTRSYELTCLVMGAGTGSLRVEVEGTFEDPDEHYNVDGGGLVVEVYEYRHLIDSD